MRQVAPRASVAGTSAPEALVALLLGLVVVQLGLVTVARVRAAGARLATRADALTALRVARYTLRRELRHGIPDRDWSAEGDSVTLRAFRGTALVCPWVATTAAEVTVRSSGDRRPDPSKDSVLLVSPTGESEARMLVGVRAATSCGDLGPDSLELWILDAAPAFSPVVGRLFERGSYHVALSALRYRRGDSGRQPLTPEVWAAASTLTVGGGRLGLDVRHEGGEAGPGWVAFLAWLEAP